MLPLFCCLWACPLFLLHGFVPKLATTHLDSILKSRDITLPTKVHLVKAMVYPVVMYGCEIWTVKRAEHRRIDAFELWCWRRLLRVPWRSVLGVLGRTDAEAETPILWSPDVKS